MFLCIYQVVPLSQRSGLLEWCEGTMPLGQYLIFANGAHGRYRPNDYSAMQCRAKLAVSRPFPSFSLNVISITTNGWKESLFKMLGKQHREFGSLSSASTS